MYVNTYHKKSAQCARISYAGRHLLKVKIRLDEVNEHLEFNSDGTVKSAQLKIMNLRRGNSAKQWEEVTDRQRLCCGWMGARSWMRRRIVFTLLPKTTVPPANVAIYQQFGASRWVKAQPIMHNAHYNIRLSVL